MEANILDVAECYDVSRDALRGHATGKYVFFSATWKKGRVFNELGWNLSNKDLKYSKIAFATTIKAFKEVKDFINIIMINFNLGHNRRALAEYLVSKIDSYKKYGIL